MRDTTNKAESEILFRMGMPHFYGNLINVSYTLADCLEVLPKRIEYLNQVFSIDITYLAEWEIGYTEDCTTWSYLFIDKVCVYTKNVELITALVAMIELLVGCGYKFKEGRLCKQ